GLVHDYTLKGRRNVLSSEILLPAGADPTLADSAKLWNHAEKMERRKDSQVAREFEIALPANLSRQARRALALRFAKYLIERYGLAAQVSIHLPGVGDQRNHHAHILTTTRDIITGKKITALDSPLTSGKEIEACRAMYAKMVNEALAAHGLEPSWDHRSHDRRGIDTKPTRHLGPASAAMARKGKAINRRAEASHDEPPSAIALAIVCARPKTRAALTSARQEMRQARLEAFIASRQGSVPISSKTPAQTHPVPSKGHSHTTRPTRAPFIINNRRGSDWRDDKDRDPDEIAKEAFHNAMQSYYAMAEAIRAARGLFDTAREDEVWTASKATAIASLTTDRNRRAVEEAWATSSGIWAAMILDDGKPVPGAALRAMERSLERPATVSETRRVKPPQCEPDGP
ncbi:MobA/MobL family protein, partial [Gluconobacter oxydans]|uniref:MobA/MobL family protein n=1 Tax=Gluconobacter oxydans TaxID=442 RepID=UPI000A913CD1